MRAPPADVPYVRRENNPERFHVVDCWLYSWGTSLGTGLRQPAPSSAAPQLRSFAEIRCGRPCLGFELGSLLLIRTLPAPISPAISPRVARAQPLPALALASTAVPRGVPTHMGNPAPPGCPTPGGMVPGLSPCFAEPRHAPGRARLPACCPRPTSSSTACMLPAPCFACRCPVCTC